MLRKLVRKLNLAKSGTASMPDYKIESEADRNKREVEFKTTLGNIEALLVDYFRLLRNAAVHAKTLSAEVEFYDAYVLRARAAVQRQYRIQPSHPSAITVADMILCSKILQTVARTLCTLVFPSIQDDVLQVLIKRFARYNDPARRRHAIISALSTDFLLDPSEAEAYVNAYLGRLA